MQLHEIKCFSKRINVVGKLRSMPGKTIAIGKCCQAAKNSGRTVFFSSAEKTGNLYFFCFYYFQFYCS